MISYIHKTTIAEALHQEREFRPNCWISLVNPTSEEIAQIDERLGLEESLMTDALDPFEVPRIEKEDGETYLFARYLTQKEGQIISFPILFIIDDKCLVTVSKAEFPFLEKLGRRLSGHTTEEKIIVLTHMLFIITREYHKVIIDYSRRIQSLNASLENISNRDIVALVNFEHTFNDLVSALVPMHLAVGQLLSGKYCRCSESEQELLEDVHLFMNQLIEMSKSNLTRIGNIRETTDTILSNKLNTTMKFLASMTLIFTIPTMIFSFFGMNVALPLQQMGLAHVVIIGMALLLSIGLVVIFSKKQLL